MIKTHAPVVSLQQAMDQLFNESFVGGTPYRTLWSRGGGGGGTAWSGMPLDVYATSDEVVILAAVPGLRPDSLDIAFHQGTLVLSGTLPNVAEDEEAKQATWFLHELPYGTFRRAVSLPFAVDADQAQATFENGVVKIVLPKAEAAKPKTIPVRIGGAGQAIAAGGQAETGA